MPYPMVEFPFLQQANIVLGCNPADPERTAVACRTGHGWLLSLNVGASLCLTSQYIIDPLFHDCIMKLKWM